jgi:hypothetical protein
LILKCILKDRAGQFLLHQFTFSFGAWLRPTIQSRMADIKKLIRVWKLQLLLALKYTVLCYQFNSYLGSKNAGCSGILII